MLSLIVAISEKSGEMIKLPYYDKYVVFYLISLTLYPKFEYYHSFLLLVYMIYFFVSEKD